MSQDLLLAIGVSIIAAALFALLARGARQPLILGYILGGAVLGPHLGLGVITDEASIELISEMGLLLLLFIIGLEISVPSLAQAGRTIMVSGLLQFPICAGLAWWLVGSTVAARTRGPFDGLYLAIALSLSSTLIVVKLLSDKLEIGTFAGRVTLGILLFQDLWAIGFLALQPSLRSLEPVPLLGSLGAGVGLVATCGVLSRLVLPRLFRSVARSHELLLITSIAWCFLVAGTAGSLGLSKEMGALIAGMVIAAFPYNTEVISRLGGVRDFFVTLFFVALGMKIPVPSRWLLLLAGATALFVVLSRFAAIFPLFALLRRDTRTAGVVSINLGQISEFSLVIVTLGAGYGHVSRDVASLVLYTLLLTSVLSTYTILFNHGLATLLTQVLAGLGIPPWLAQRRSPEEAASSLPRKGGAGDIFFLGVSREGLAFLRHLERERPAMKDRIVAVDFNPETLEQLRADGVECHYGDISNAETLRHAGIERAGVVVSSISDWLLRGTDNLRLLRQVRRLVPGARVIVTADTLAAAERLYTEGADYVLIPPALAAEHLYDLLLHGSAESLAAARRQQADSLLAPRGAAPDAPDGDRQR
ncbi:MAG TPA: cation:proton antiporter [Methylomirabilota bacterium]|jgi:Kef-type K+ transport system membrane component KefB/Trk K+ transport system NAD-binding subunit|nr:cation:proton antiporter [Methylomirabilota bacterium]